jgi:hypothetical protein
MRSVDNDLLKSSTTVSENLIGSVASFRNLRFRTISAGGSNGTVKGRFIESTSMLEGIEFGNPPHRFGYAPVHKDGVYAIALSDSVLWEPAIGKQYVVTDLIITFGGATDGVVKIFDETAASGNYLFVGTIDVSVVGGGRPLVINLKTPFVSSTKNNKLKITSTANIDFSIVAHGYEF